MDQAVWLACARLEQVARLDRAPQTYARGCHAHRISPRAEQNISRLVSVAALYLAAGLTWARLTWTAIARGSALEHREKSWVSVPIRGQGQDQPRQMDWGRDG